tara:strand:- start:648 stop:1112 length:465 start_codon:yes stop_codon:yes gene_type:complete
MSNTLVSIFRNQIPHNVRIIVQLTIIASLVVLADLMLKGFMYDVSKELSVFVALIITNCIVLGRADGFAMNNSVKDSFIDGFANSLGYGIILVLVAIFREFLGSGTIYGVTIFPESLYANGYIDNGLMLLAPGAFIVLGLIIWVQRTATGFVEE